MLTYDTYKLIHLFGLFTLFLALGGLFVHAAAGGEKRHSARGLVMAAHGLGAFLVVLGGFGMLARLEGSGIPAWVHPKLVIWVLLAGAVALPHRYPAVARPMLVLLPILGGVAAWIGIFHP
jgi:hypothetical protein